MTIAATPRKAGPYIGNGSVHTYSFAFKVLDTAHLTVVEANAAGVEATLVLASDYTVLLNEDQEATPGGTITRVVETVPTPLPLNYRWAILSATPYSQTTDLPSGGPFSALVVENGLDNLEIQTQQLVEAMERVVQVPPTSSETSETIVASLIAAGAAAGASAAAAAASEAAADASATAAAASEAAAEAAAATFEVSAATLVALKGLTAGAAPVVYLLGRVAGGDGGQGAFLWISGDQSANVTADPQAGLWVPPDSAPTGASGAWKRADSRVLDPGFYGAAAAASAATNTAAINACLVAAIAANKDVHFREHGTYSINDELVLAMESVQAPRIDLGGSTLNQTTNNKAVFRIKANTVHSGCIRNGVLTWASAQPAANTSAIGIAIQSPTGGGATFNGVYQYTFEDLRVYNGYRGIANAQASGTFPTWGIRIQRTWISSMSGAAVYLRSPTAIGQPAIALRDVYVDNVGANTTEPSISIGQCKTLVLSNVEFNRILTEALALYQCNIDASAVKVENGQGFFTSFAADNVLLLSQCTGRLHEFEISGVTFDRGGGTTTYIVRSIDATGVSEIEIGSITVGTNTITTGKAILIRTTDGVPLVMARRPAYTGTTTPTNLPLTDISATGSANTLVLLDVLAQRVSADRGDASVTVTPGIDEPVQLFSAALSANRVVTLLPATGASPAADPYPMVSGVWFRIVRTGGGAFTLDVQANGVSLAIIPASSKGVIEVSWRRLQGWKLTNYGVW